MNNRIIKFAIAPGSQLNSGLDLGGLLNFLTQNSFFEYSDTINKPRVMGVSSGQISLVGLSSIGLYSFWYSKESMSKFHLFNDWNNWSNMDKAGHIYSSYHLSKISSNNKTGFKFFLFFMYSNLANFKAIRKVFCCP